MVNKALKPFNFKEFVKNLLLQLQVINTRMDFFLPLEMRLHLD